MAKLQYFIAGMIIMWLAFIGPKAVLNFIIGYR